MYPFTVWKLYTLTNKINRLYSGQIQTWIEEDPNRTRRTTEILEILEWVPNLIHLNEFSHHMLTEFRHFIEDIVTDPPTELVLLQDLHSMLPILFYIQDIEKEVVFEELMDEILPSIGSLFVN